jgi:hypothetical protein
LAGNRNFLFGSDTVEKTNTQVFSAKDARALPARAPARGGTYARNPRFEIGKFAKFGNTAAIAESGIPNHEHNVTPY